MPSLPYVARFKHELEHAWIISPSLGWSAYCSVPFGRAALLLLSRFKQGEHARISRHEQQGYTCDTRSRYIVYNNANKVPAPSRKATKGAFDTFSHLSCGYALSRGILLFLRYEDLAPNVPRFTEYLTVLPSATLRNIQPPTVVHNTMLHIFCTCVLATLTSSP